jgi:hypothetical protein
LYLPVKYARVPLESAGRHPAIMQAFERGEPKVNPQVNLSTCSVLVVFTSSSWQARKTDKQVNLEIVARHNTDERATSVRKSLLPMDAASYEAIGTAYTAAYETHRKNTLPWLDNGARILPSANYEAYANAMRAHKDAFEEAVRVFLTEYPTLRQNARQYLNGMYRESDYPDLATMVGRFSFETKVYPMPDAADFRVNLSADTIASIKANVEQSSQDALRNAMQDVNTRILDALSAMQSRLAEPKGIFRDTLFTNLAELVEIAPRLNITNDPALTARCEEIKAQVLQCAPETARKNPAERQRVLAEVNRIADLMK